MMKLASIAAIAAVSLTTPALAKGPNPYQEIRSTPFLATVYATEAESTISGKVSDGGRPDPRSPPFPQHVYRLHASERLSPDGAELPF
jgi:hypothetical protein